MISAATMTMSPSEKEAIAASELSCTKQTMEGAGAAALRWSQVGSPLAWSFPAMLFTVAAMAAGAFAVYFYAPSWRLRRVPGPLAYGLLGHLPLLDKHGSQAFGVLAKRYGPIYRFYMGRQPVVVVADPELCREAGIKKFKSMVDRSVPVTIASSPIQYKSLLFTKGSTWQAMRNVIISIYQPSHLASLIPAIQPYIERAGSLFFPGEEITFSDLSIRLFTDVIGQAAFGVDFGLTNEQGGEKGIDGAVSGDFIQKHLYATTSLKMDLSGSLSMVAGTFLPALQEPLRQLLLRVPGSVDQRMDDSNASLSAELDGIVAERTAQANSRRDGQKNFLSVLLNAIETSESMRELFTPDYVSALTYEHLIAGSGTMSFTLSSLAYLVAMHPVVEEKLLREIDAFEPKNTAPDADDLRTKFPYLEQVLKETMRFFVGSPVLSREATDDVEIGGYFLPKGTWVWLASEVLGRDPEQFQEPDAFRPERFDPESEECKRRHPYAFIPFGIGPRSCPGQKFAFQQLKLVVIYLYGRYVFRHSPSMESPLQLQFSIITNFKHGVKLQVIDRKA
ncbi:cytochrome P450 711A1-like [Hordeum vulgare subsp. vulgare]|uniref:cytochrome P450 711A1-like n=1 Tax=Hordeum vulgare subsp. vulgare TaxID=112509 RepID=UPI000294B555|nr:cytochrome P450 711A1-like [Hordeum vulgare subsp. vulgare]